MWFARIARPTFLLGGCRNKSGMTVLGALFALLLVFTLAEPAFAQAAPAPIVAPATPGTGDAIDRALGDLGGGEAPLSLSLQLLIIMGLLTILPSILLMMTSFRM